MKYGWESFHVWARHVINTLSSYKLAVFRYEYHGQGDSLNDEYCHVYETMESFDKDDGQDPTTYMPTQTIDLIKDFAYSMVEHHYAGWENNEGGWGRVEIFVRPEGDEGPHVKFNHWEYVTTENHRGEHDYR